MALPLKVGDRVIGALDVQSIESNAFSQEDIQLFSILADQVAIAIYNSRLYLETAQALAEAQMVHRRYLSQEWNREVEEGEHYGYRYTPQGLEAQRSEEISGIEEALQEGRPVVEGSAQEMQEGSGVTSLTVPVKLRGETIGVIRLQDEASGSRSWTEEEVETVQSVADQVALALENARLFTQTARKADRERRVLEITSKIRSTNDPQAMLQIAVEELQRTLRASRAQVVLQPRVPEPAGPGDNGNGKNGNGYKHDRVE
jgi:GAF domain-containing protein